MEQRALEIYRAKRQNNCPMGHYQVLARQFHRRSLQQDLKNNVVSPLSSDENVFELFTIAKCNFAS